MKKIDVAILGTNFGQKIHRPALESLGNMQVTALYHRSLATAQAMAKDAGLRAFNSVAGAIESVQAVAISTPPFAHFEMAKAAIEAGKPVFLEKPIALTAPEGRVLYRLAQEKKVAVAVDFEFRFIPAWLRLKELLEENYVGRLRYVKVDWLGASRADADRAWNWYAQKEMGGGTLGSIGSHAFDYIHWLFGPSRRLSARLSTVILSRPDGAVRRPVTSDDVCNITLEQPDGTPIQVCLSAVTNQGRGHFVEIYGDRGTLVLGNPSQTDYIHGFTLMGRQGSGELEVLEVPDRLAFSQTFSDGRIAPIARVMEQWVANFGTPGALVPGLREGVYAQLLMDCCQDSNLSGRWVEIPELDAFL
jgi:predicted dehydrogenase